MAVPVINITYHSTDIISDEFGETTCTVKFQSDTSLLEWEARAGGTGHGSGELVGSGGNESSNTDVEFTVDYTELTQGDGTYTIYVYGRNEEGWSG
jgi:hypothetical protein